MKQCTYVEVRPHMRGNSWFGKILTPIGGLCCVGSINPSGVIVGVWRQRLALSIGRN
jgi:hypothetical protein